MKNYEIIELDLINDLIQKNELDLAAKIYKCLINKLKKYYIENNYNITFEIELIDVDYMGKYPAIGIYYLQNHDAKKNLDFEKKSLEILNTILLTDFIENI